MQVTLQQEDNSEGDAATIGRFVRPQQHCHSARSAAARRRLYPCQPTCWACETHSIYAESLTSRIPIQDRCEHPGSAHAEA